MITNVLGFKYSRVLNIFSKNKIPTLGIILLFIVSSLSAAYPQIPNTMGTEGKAIVWNVQLDFDEPGGAYEYSIFGEAPDANDGPPVDSYDTLKPPAPMPPYIRAWFDDSLPYPYHMLLEDYRHYPGLYKMWNLSVQWWPQTGSSPTTITISWSSSEINTTEYVSITLCTSGGTPLKDMLMYNTYSFVCPAFVPQMFRIVCVGNQAPNTPSSPSPSNGSVGVVVNADLSWTCTDPDGDPLTYDVYFGTSSSPPIVYHNWSGLSYNLGTLAYNTLYYWRIVAWDNHGASAVGPLWHFTTGVQPNDPPYTPNTPSPANGSTGVSINADLSWLGGDPNPGDTVTYDVYFGMSSNPPKVSSNQSVLIYNPGTLAYYTMYYWKIVAWDNHGASTAGPRWQFRTAQQINNPPYEPSDPSPANGATGVPVNSDLSWTGGDPDGDNVKYDVYFDTVNPPLTKIKSNTSGTSCILENLNYSQKYYWKVVAWDDQGASTAGPVWSFTTKLDTTGPSLAITAPKKGWLYVNLLLGLIHWKFPILVTTIVLGPIDVTATASDSQSGMNRVEFWVDDTLMETVYTTPYSWYWGHVPGFPYQLTVKAYDNLNNPSTLSLRVWKAL